jgi:hypothetical protein
MVTTIGRAFCAIVLLLTSPLALQAQVRENAVPAASAQILAGPKPSFLENKGQWDSQAKFLFKSGNVNLWITDSGIVYDEYETWHSIPMLSSMQRKLHPELLRYDTITRTGHIVRMAFRNMAHPRIVASDVQPGTTNYLIGNDRSKWVTDVHTYGDVKIEEIYKGVDAVFYLDKDGAPRYDLVVHPGADTKQIVLAFSGQDGLIATGADEFTIRTSMGDLDQCGLYAYQRVREGCTAQEQVACAFDINQNSALFDVGSYDNSRDLVIDPLLYSTCLGGNRDDGDGMSMTVDRFGCAYAVGGTQSKGVYPEGYPTTTGAYQTVNKASTTVFITKLNPSGTALSYSTYLGGTGQEWSNAIAVDDSGHAFVAGYTGSRDFPVTPGAFSTQYLSSSFVAELNASGSDLVFSTFLSGDQLEAIAHDASGNVYVAGKTPYISTTSVGIQKTFGGGQYDAFVTKLNATGSTLIYSTFIGGSGMDGATGLAVDPAGAAYAAGNTNSSDFPTTPGAFQAIGAKGHTPDSSIITVGGGSGFVAKIDPTGLSLDYSTLLTGTGGSEIWGIAVSNAGEAFVTGYSVSGFPVTPGAYKAASLGGADIFTSKLNTAGSALIYSTFLNIGPADLVNSAAPGGIAIDGFGNAYVVASTESGMVTTSDAVQSGNNGRQDAVLVKLNANGTKVLYATYLGGTDIEQAEGVAVDPSGNAYLCGFTTSLPSMPVPFPTTPTAFQPVNHGAKGDAFVAKIGIAIPILSLQIDSVSLPLCGSNVISCLLENGSGGSLTVDSASIAQPFSTDPAEFPLQIQNGTGQHIIVLFSPQSGGSFSSNLTIHYRTSDGTTHDTILPISAIAKNGAGETASTQSNGTVNVLPLTTLDIPTKVVLSSVRALDTMQIQKIDFALQYDSTLLDMNPNRLDKTVLPPAGLQYGSASVQPGLLHVEYTNPSHTTLTDTLKLGDLLFTTYIGDQKSTLVTISALSMTTPNATYNYCTDIEGSYLENVVIESAGVELEPVLNSMHLYPNPLTKGTASLEVSMTNPARIEISLFDLLGREMFHLTPNDLGIGISHISLPTDVLSSGTYYVRVATPAGTSTIKLSVE